MMNAELLLKLQAWVDGELPASEAARVAELVRTDTAAAALAAELRMTRGFLAGNEPEVKLPESREFHWSKIQRAIERAEAEPIARESLPWLAALRRLLVPVSGVALVAFLTVVSIGIFNRTPPTGTGDELLVEEETLSRHVETTTWHSQANNMYVVYIVNKDEVDDDAMAVDTDVDEDMDDSVIQ
jgi:anti-sigma factor RsiW